MAWGIEGRSRANPHYRLSTRAAGAAAGVGRPTVSRRRGASATRICSSAAGSSIVVRSPGSRAFGERLDRPAQQLAGARLRQQRHEVNASPAARSRQARDRPSASPRGASSAAAAVSATRDGVLHDANAIGTCPLSSSCNADDGDLGDACVRLHRLLDLARAEPVAGDVDHVVGAPEHEVVAVGVAGRPVEGRIELPAGNRLEVRRRRTARRCPRRSSCSPAAAAARSSARPSRRRATSRAGGARRRA